MCARPEGNTPQWCRGHPTAGTRQPGHKCNRHSHTRTTPPPQPPCCRTRGCLYPNMQPARGHIHTCHSHMSLVTHTCHMSHTYTSLTSGRSRMRACPTSSPGVRGLALATRSVMNLTAAAAGQERARAQQDDRARTGTAAAAAAQSAARSAAHNLVREAQNLCAGNVPPPPPTARHTLGPTAPYPTLTPTSPPTRLPRCCKQRMHTPLPSPLQHKRRGCPHQILRTPPAPPGLMPVPLPPLPPTKTATTNLSTHTQTHALCRPHSLVPLALHHLALLYA